MNGPTDKNVGKMTLTELRKSLSTMTIDELREFIKKQGSEIQFEIASTETFNTKYASPPRTES